MTESALSPAAAAKIASVSRSAIMRAINSKELKALRDNRNRWQIDRADLLAWSANRPEQNRTVSDTDRSVSGQVGGTVPPMFEQLAELKAELAASHAEKDGLRALLASVQEDRDRWRDLATRPAPSLIERIRRTFSSS